MSWAEVDVIKKEIINRSGAVKSVQRGSLEWGVASNYGYHADVTISAVNTAKVNVRVNQYSRDADAYYINKDDIFDGLLINSTTLRVFGSRYRNGNAATIDWEVTEFR